MKKSQVLAVVALAFALGLAPIASTFAVSVAPAELTATQKCLNAYAEAIEVVGGQTAWNNWSALGTAVTALETAVDTSVTAQNTSGSNVAKLIAGIEANVSGVTTNSIKLAIAGKDIYGVIAYAEGQIVSTEAYKTALEGVIDGVKSDIQTKISTVVEDMQKIDKNVSGSLVNSKAGEVLSAAKNLNGKYEAVMALQDSTITCAGDDDEVTDKTTAKINALIAAYKNATPVTPVTPNEPADEGDKPTTPDTGVNTASEESATASVSILSGVASVVTAAGVVIRKAFRK